VIVHGPARTTVTGTALPSESNTWVIPSFVPRIPTVIKISSACLTSNFRAEYFCRFLTGSKEIGFDLSKKYWFWRLFNGLRDDLQKISSQTTRCEKLNLLGWLL